MQFYRGVQCADGLTGYNSSDCLEGNTEAASTIPGPSALVVQTVQVLRPVRTVGECGSGTRNEHVGRALSVGMKRGKGEIRRSFVVYGQVAKHC